MPHEKFDVTKLERLNDPARFDYLIPEVLWAAAGVPDPRSIVDIGAGTGLFTFRFAELAPNAEIFAVDLEPMMVRWVLDHRPAAVRDRVKPLLASESAIPLPTGEADLVVMINVHHELADPLSSYREALRLLRIGGTVLIADWRPGEASGGPSQEVRVDAETIRALLGRVGFADVEVRDGLPKHSLLTARKPAVCAL